jgi:CRISPR-associated protein Csx14
MATAEIPVDLFNPGQVFACLGFMEAAEVLLGGARGGFDWSDPGDSRFHLEAAGDEHPVEAVLEFLFQAEVSAMAPFGSGLRAKEAGIDTKVAADRCFPCPEPATPSALPVRLADRRGGALRVEHWCDATRQRDTVKFWAGMGGYSGAALTRDLLEQLSRWSAAARRNAVTDPFAIPSTQSSSFRFDLRGSYVPLDLGFSLNEHSQMNVVGYPLVELLAAIGLQHARPMMRAKLHYVYGAWSGRLPLPLARAALGAQNLGFPMRSFSMVLGWPGKEGQARCILFSQEEPAHD